MGIDIEKLRFAPSRAGFLAKRYLMRHRKGCRSRLVHHAGRLRADKACERSPSSSSTRSITLRPNASLMATSLCLGFAVALAGCSAMCGKKKQRARQHRKFDRAMLQLQQTKAVYSAASECLQRHGFQPERCSGKSIFCCPKRTPSQEAVAADCVSVLRLKTLGNAYL